MGKLLQAPVTAMFLGGLSFLLTMLALLQKPLENVARPAVHTEAEQMEGFWQRHNPEVDQLLIEIKREKEELVKKGAELRELEARLQLERAEITQVTQRVAQLQMEFDQNIVRVKEEETPNLKKLAKLYVSMSPEGASAILRELDDEVVVKIFSCMKEEESAPLLDAMAMEGETQAKRAAAIAEALRTRITEKKKSP
jgi:flagellar motility protein MotE (MotC chaperone)